MTTTPKEIEVTVTEPDLKTYQGKIILPSYGYDVKKNTYYQLKQTKDGSYSHAQFTLQPNGDLFFVADVTKILKEQYYVFHQSDNMEPFKRISETEFQKAIQKTLTYL